MTTTPKSPAITRRDCLAGSGVALLLGAGPALAQAKLDTRLNAPPGNRREAPAFRRFDLDK